MGNKKTVFKFRKQYLNKSSYSYVVKAFILKCNANSTVMLLQMEKIFFERLIERVHNATHMIALIVL